MPRGRGREGKWTDSSDGMEEIKKLLHFVSAELSKISKRQDKQQDLLFGLMDKIEQLKIQINDKDQKITLLEQRVNELELSERRNDLLITGFDVMVCS